jgi:hypothetical protein
MSTMPTPHSWRTSPTADRIAPGDSLAAHGTPARPQPDSPPPAARFLTSRPVSLPASQSPYRHKRCHSG